MILHEFFLSAISLGVMISAFQADDPGSIPGSRIFLILYSYFDNKIKYNIRETMVSYSKKYKAYI